MNIDIKILEELYENILHESSMINVYHGDDYGTTEIIPRNMWLGGNSQEGIGIYFGSMETAEQYGKYITMAKIDPRKYPNSRVIASDILNINKTAKFLKILWKNDEESMYYYITDYMYIPEIKDIKDYHMKEFASLLLNNELRNFQIELVERMGIDIFVDTWNKIFPDIHGTYEPVAHFFAILNTDVKLTPVNFEAHND